MLLRHRREAGQQLGVVDDREVSQQRAVGQGGDAGLEVQDLGDRHRDDLHPFRSGDLCQLTDALLVGALPGADVHPVAELEHVAAVEGAGALDPRDPVAQPGDRALGAGGLRPPLRGTRPCDDSEIAMDHHRVLDEDRVRAVVRRLDLDRLPAVGLEGSDVVDPLRQRELVVHGPAVEMGQQPLGEPAAGTTDERASSTDVREQEVVHGWTLPSPWIHRTADPVPHRLTLRMRHRRGHTDAVTVYVAWTSARPERDRSVNGSGRAVAGGLGRRRRAGLRGHQRDVVGGPSRVEMVPSPGVARAVAPVGELPKAKGLAPETNTWLRARLR